MNNCKCKLCGRDIIELPRCKDTESYLCGYCGSYSIVDGFDIDYYEDKSSFYKLSSYIKEQNCQFNSKPLFDYENFNEILSIRDKKIKEKFDLLMLYLSEHDELSELKDEVIVKCWLNGHEDLHKIYTKGLELGYIDGTDKPYNAYPLFRSLTFDGLEYVESLGDVNEDSQNIFVAFDFDDQLNDTFNIALKNEIESKGFNYIAVDQNKIDDNKTINDDIIAKLKSSRIVISDLTNHRNNIYFKAGFAMGMNIPIIWTCHKDHEEDISFDTRQYPHILWEDEKDLVKQVMNRVKVIL